MDSKLKKWFEGKIWYDLNSTQIWAETKKDGCQHIVDIRGWGAIQNMFKDQNQAAKFQDSVGEFVASAIREKIALGNNKLTHVDKSCTGSDEMHVFKVRDYITELVGRYNKEGKFYYIQRGDGSMYKYDSDRITFSKKL